MAPDTEKYIYLDHNATTPVHPEVAAAVRPFVSGFFGNPSTLYTPAQRVRNSLEHARSQVAALLGCASKQIVFTSGGTEANNLAVKGAFFKNRTAQRRRIVVSAIEHPSVLASCRWLAEYAGAQVTVVPPEPAGRVEVQAFAAAFGADVCLACLMHANNETGVLQPVRELANIARDCGIWFHVDGVQAAGKIPVSVEKLGCDSYAISGHKFGALKGAGALYFRSARSLAPILSGGHQEAGLRPGTENVPGIVALGCAAEIAARDMESNRRKCTELREIFETIAQRLPMTRINGRRAPRLPNTVSLCCLYADALSVVMGLNMQGIFVGAGAACAAHTREPSHVLLAMGLSPRAAHCTLRISFGPELKADAAAVAADRIIETVTRVRTVTAPGKIGACDENCPCFNH